MKIGFAFPIARSPDDPMSRSLEQPGRSLTL
jgi:hypothetical protein